MVACPPESSTRAGHVCHAIRDADRNSGRAASVGGPPAAHCTQQPKGPPILEHLNLEVTYGTWILNNVMPQRQHQRPTPHLLAVIVYRVYAPATGRLCRTPST